MRRTLSQLFILFVTITALLLSGCGESQQPTTPEKQVPAVKQEQPNWESYIYQHTSGLIGKDASLRIRFVNDAIPTDRVGQEFTDLITLEPATAGTVHFENPRELVFTPAAPLKSGQDYRLTLKTSGIQGFPDAIGPYTFAFTVIRQNFVVDVAGLSVDPADKQKMFLTGSIETADAAATEPVEQILSAAYRGTDLAIDWWHRNDNRRHEFSVRDIPRQQQADSLTLTWNGAPLELKNQGSRTIEVPARDSFMVTGVRTVQSDRQAIRILFSDPLSRTQNRRGLITLSSGRHTETLSGNSLEIYPGSQISGDVTVTIDASLRNSDGRALGTAVTRTITFEPLKPEVHFVGSGAILPHSERLTIPFESVNVHSVQVTAFKIYNNNLGQFLQDNNLDGDSSLNLVGRNIWRKTIRLTDVERDKWQRHLLDATELLEREPGSLYRLTLSINRGDSIYACSDADNAVPVPKESPLSNWELNEYNESSNWDWYENSYNSGNYKWEDRRNPCKDSYYNYADGVSDARNFVASNIGIIAKQGSDKRFRFITTDLQRAEPLAQTLLTLYNFQNQPIAVVSTDAQGLAELEVDEQPFYLVAEQGQQKGYLKLNPGNALPVSHFDVGGQKVKRGVKGTLYGERGVWRPGDDIYLTFVLQDSEDVIPPEHPVTLELFNPLGQLMQTVTNTTPVGDFYAFHLKTSAEDITGNWTAKARLGGMTFTKKLNIATVVPNHLKLELNFGATPLRKGAMPLQTELFAQWLHGAKAGGLAADVSAELSSTTTRFERYGDYSFDDPAREFYGEPQRLFDGTLDKDGYARFAENLLYDSKPAGALKARFTSRVFEPGGAFSTATQTVPFYPYDNYIGIKLPKGDPARGMLLTDTAHRVDIVSLDPTGQPTSTPKIDVTLYKIDWKWWWDKSGESLANFASANHTEAVASGTVATKDGKGSWEFEIKYPSWGRYLVRACDADGDHCTGKIIYVDWPGWAGRAQQERGIGATALTLYSDKPSYQVGETATINLPQAKQGRALLSVENGTGILEQRWLELAKGETSFALPVTAAMSPNVYVSVTLVQPHDDRENDLPIRMYGIIPINVENPQTRLNPQLKVADELRPESTVEVEVAEADGRPMTYTLALVDEGLLGLTNFRTPDLRSYFYRKEALGVSTWDMFDEVVGAYSGELERLLALGGDEDAGDKQNDKDKRRFPPVVRFFGPYQLAAGEKVTHQIELPQYIGAVRLMLVAGRDGAYGRDEKTVPVRQPLTLLPTVPRVLGPGEEATLPVSIFVMDDTIKDVELAVTTDDHFTIVGANPIHVPFSEPGDQLGTLALKVGEATGTGEINFRAQSGTEQATQTIYVPVRSANPSTLRQQRTAIAGGESWQAELTPHGLPGTNRLFLELSRIPPLNLEQRLRYLIQYPHGCIEQTTSSAFPQLFLPGLVELDSEQLKEVSGHIEAAIERLHLFQQGNGGFSYWPGTGEISAWGTSYAGHFLLEAKRSGYQVPSTLLNNWISYQSAAAQRWDANSRTSSLDQAYRLYTLVLAGAPELGAMNRLREYSKLDNMGLWQLAAAYQQLGLSDAARELVARAALTVGDYRRAGITLGSALRDRALILSTLSALGDDQRAMELAEIISAELSSDNWHSTQATAWALLAMARFSGTAADTNSSLAFSYRIGDAAEEAVDSDKPVYRVELMDIPASGAPVTITNPGTGKLYACLSAEGVPPIGEEQASANGLALKVEFLDLAGKVLNIEQLPQGQDFQARVELRNLTPRDFENLALTQIMPSGWQIHNPDYADEESTADFDYQDVRDDRVLTYLGLKSGERKTFSVLLNASFRGRYYLPAWSVEAMYNARYQARNKGRWVRITRDGE
ncbi:MAG: hypothetical protein C0622_06635 [Desulfuromonas sp.]|nr:MAG: hypothetical protein C0622_06635 [Desulfuromonas sp.]